MNHLELVCVLRQPMGEPSLWVCLKPIQKTNSCAVYDHWPWVCEVLAKQTLWIMQLDQELTVVRLDRIVSPVSCLKPEKLYVQCES